MNHLDVASNNKQIGKPVVSIFTSRWVMGFQIFVTVVLTGAMELKTFLRFRSSGSPALEVKMFDLLLAAFYPLMIVICAWLIYASVKRRLLEMTKDALLLRMISFQGLLLLNLTLLGMDVLSPK